ncbi:hypothetical protein ACFQ51_50105 [Streptomyces kaempferi]
MLVLAEESVARAAGAPILAEVLGYGLSADGYHATAPHPEGEGAARAIRGALKAAGITPQDVGYINGHGTGTPKNDSAESNAVRAAFGEAADKTALSSSKSMIGHLLGAAARSRPSSPSRPWWNRPPRRPPTSPAPTPNADSTPSPTPAANWP